MTVQADSCQTWSETPKTDFVVDQGVISTALEKMINKNINIDNCMTSVHGFGEEVHMNSNLTLM